MKKILVAMVALVLVLTGCGKENVGSKLKNYNGEKDAVLTVNGENISVDEFNYFLIMSSYDIASKYDMEDKDRTDFWDKKDEETGKTLKQLALDNAVLKLTPYHIYRTQCKEEGIELTKEDKEIIKQNNERMSSKYGDKMNELQLSAGGLTPEVFNDMNEMSQYSVCLYHDYSKNYRKISDDEVKKYYKKNYIRAKHILALTINPETNEPLSEEEKKQAYMKISGVKARIDNGESFESLVDEFNEDPSYDDYPDGFTMTKDDEYAKSFKDTAFSLKEGEVSDIIESESGYHIIKRDVLLDEYMSDELITEKIIKTDFQKKLDKLQEEADIRINGTVYNQVNVESVLSNYLKSQDTIMSQIQKEYERLYAESEKSEESN